MKKYGHDSHWNQAKRDISGSSPSGMQQRLHLRWSFGFWLQRNQCKALFGDHGWSWNWLCLWEARQRWTGGKAWLTGVGFEAFSLGSPRWYHKGTHDVSKSSRNFALALAFWWFQKGVLLEAIFARGICFRQHIGCLSYCHVIMSQAHPWQSWGRKKLVAEMLVQATVLKSSSATHSFAQHLGKGIHFTLCIPAIFLSTLLALCSQTSLSD